MEKNVMLRWYIDMETKELKKKFTFQRGYVGAAVILFFIEVAIALWVHDGFVRPYFGDFLVQIFVYCALHSFLAGSVMMLATVALFICYGVEVLQAIHFVEHIGLADNQVAATLIGTQFSWWDMLAYTLGFAAVIIVEKGRKLVLKQ